MKEFQEEFMKIHVVLLIVVVMICSATFSGRLLASDTNGKIPVTTSSEKAKSEFLKGLDLADKLRAQDSSEFFRRATVEDPKFAIAYLNLAFTEPSADALFA